MTSPKSLYISFIFVFFSVISWAQCIDSTQINPVHFCEDFYSAEDFLESYNPVCGCDGKTYFDFFCAFRMGVTEWTPGPCNECFDSLNISQVPFQFPTVSTPTYINMPRDQVCGCDGKSYLSALSAYIAGNTAWEKGSCACIDSSVIDLNIDFELCERLYYWGLNSSLGPQTDPRRLFKGCNGEFYANACEAYYRHGVTRFVSLIHEDCQILPEELHEPLFPCDSIYEPVCGCDRITYQNACIAEKHHGVYEHYLGECNCIDTTIIGSFNSNSPELSTLHCQGLLYYTRYQPVCGCDGKTYYNDCIALNHNGVPTYKSGACQCIDSSLYDPVFECDTTILEPYCGCDGSAHVNVCVGVYKNAVAGNRTCNCIEEGLINEEIDCAEYFDVSPVCGCDGRTYPNACYAARKAGVTFSAPRPCESTCKDSILILDEVPCSDAYYPVCGCDLITYQNECHARYKNGVLKWTEGPCTLSSAENPATDINVSIYPNPSSGKLYLSGITNHDYLIMDSTGRIIQQGKQQPTLDITSIPAGMYIIRLFNENNSYKSFKIIKT